MNSTKKIIAMIAVLSLTAILKAPAEEEGGDKKSAEEQAPAEHPSGSGQHATAPHQNNTAHAENAQTATHHNNVEHATNDHGQTASNVTDANSTQSAKTSSQLISVQHAHVQHLNPQESQAAANSAGGYQTHDQGSYRQNSSNQSGLNSYRSSGSASAPQVSQAGVTQSGNPGSGQQYSQPQITPNNQYNSGNNYGGNWSAANTHSGWNHSGQHYWNNNNYMWYQGGWLILTSSFNPFYVNSGNSSYASPVSSVQTSLASRGYYNGPIDGNLGRGTRNAISSYQNDNNLNVTGHINGALLQSLQIQ